MQDSTEVTKPIRQEVFQRVDALAQKLGVGAEQLWEVLIRQQYVEAGLSVLMFGFVLWVWVQVGMPVTRTLAEEHDKGILGQDESVIFGGWIMMIVLVLAALGIGYGTVESIGRLINPEYYALQEIVEALP